MGITDARKETLYGVEKNVLTLVVGGFAKPPIEDVGKNVLRLDQTAAALDAFKLVWDGWIFLDEVIVTPTSIEDSNQGNN